MLKPVPSSVTTPDRLRELAALRQRITLWRSEGQRIGFVPTMGALHAGHLALVKHARSLSDKVVVSIFVNPLQFAPHEDFDRYPRREDADSALLAEAGADLVWLPTSELMYPKGFATKIELTGPAEGLETDFRPQFFGGVATVVTKLFNQVTPDIAVFGEKDYQQLKVVQTFTRDLDMPLEVIGLPTIRESDGLALSSRNAYLSAEERDTAAKLHAELHAIAETVQAGGDADASIERAKIRLEAAGFGPIDYIALRDADSLAPPSADSRALRLLAAAWLGKTRLIDNIAV
ncbi:pantoate--beta-alanine ligase [Asticcacaulis tiandongensis]|uniref:pantoate--beta-alanine ligase n=1 Tax=Asticcacaulis tiandongensis TaxID=2565365 RepID=UPI00112C3DA9|nr:pantoate--beta-alanine ligase [Asticcacaulis tiandongensis]